MLQLRGGRCGEIGLERGGYDRIILHGPGGFERGGEGLDEA